MMAPAAAGAVAVVLFATWRTGPWCMYWLPRCFALGDPSYWTGPACRVQLRWREGGSVWNVSECVCERDGMQGKAEQVWVRLGQVCMWVLAACSTCHRGWGGGWSAAFTAAAAPQLPPAVWTPHGCACDEASALLGTTAALQA